MVNTSTLTMHITLTQFKRMWKYAAGQLERPWKTHFFAKGKWSCLVLCSHICNALKFCLLKGPDITTIAIFVSLKIWHSTFFEEQGLLLQQVSSTRWIRLKICAQCTYYFPLSLFSCVRHFVQGYVAGFWQKDIKKISTFVAFYYVPYKSFLFTKEK